MDPVATSARSSPSLGEMAAELWADVRGLVADEVDLLAAEAHVALRTLLLGVVLAVSAAVFAVLAAGAVLAVIAVELVERGLTWAAALGIVFVVCAASSFVLLLALRGIALKKHFARTRNELRGRG
jgi:hypothetical protein